MDVPIVLVLFFALSPLLLDVPPPLALMATPSLPLRPKADPPGGAPGVLGAPVDPDIDDIFDVSVVVLVAEEGGGVRFGMDLKEPEEPDDAISFVCTTGTDGGAGGDDVFFPVPLAFGRIVCSWKNRQLSPEQKHGVRGVDKGKGLLDCCVENVFVL